MKEYNHEEVTKLLDEMEFIHNNFIEFNKNLSDKLFIKQVNCCLDVIEQELNKIAIIVGHCNFNEFNKRNVK